MNSSGPIVASHPPTPQTSSQTPQRSHVSDSQLMHHQGHMNSSGPIVASHPPTPQTSSQTPQVCLYSITTLMCSLKIGHLYVELRISIFVDML
uniref:Ovule protein n=1 Tax=Ascaris lumbricoides TaxID=6252 RepID=A0A0M3IXL6_ASCLU